MINVLAITAPEVVGIVRDIVLISISLFAILALFLFSVMALLLYRKITKLLSKTEQRLDELAPAISGLTAAGKAVSNVVGMTQAGFGVKGVLGAIGRMFAGGKKDRND